MECKSCRSRWETERRVTSSLVACPFCGASLTEEEKFFDNAKDALVFIARKHGNDVLLGKQLRAFFPDYAPSVSANMKGLVFAVYEKGAAQILRSHQNATGAEKEIAVKRAVAKLTEAFIAREAAENIIGEFVEALGWQVGAPVTVQPPVSQTPQRQTAPVQTRQQIQPQTIQQPKPAFQAGTGAAAEILQGKKMTVQFGPYKWRVLEALDDRALLLTDDVIEKRPYNTQGASCNWGTCTLRQYLNGEFLCKFNGLDQLRILYVYNTNMNNQWRDTAGGNDTTDRVFLLSIEDAVRYFSNGRMPMRSAVHWYSGWLTEPNRDLVARYGNRMCWWWLRSPGFNGSRAASVRVAGELDMSGDLVGSAVGGVRPALWLNLKT